MPFTQINGSVFTSTGVGVWIPVPSSADYFVTKNLTQIATTATPGVGFMFEWYGSNFGVAATPLDGATKWSKADGSDATSVSQVTSGGFTYVKKIPYVQPAVVGTVVTNADPAIVIAPNSFSNGDRVVLTGTTGMNQIAGMVFSIDNVSATSFSLPGLDASTFAAAASAVTVRRLSPVDAVEPEFLYVTKITKAVQGVVTVSQKHNYVVGQVVHFQIPPSFGMVELNGMYQTTPIKIVAVTPYTFTIDLNTSSFSTFAFPLSTASPTAQLFATVSSGGQRAQQDYTTKVYSGYDFSYVPFHSGMFTPSMYLAAGANSPAGQQGDVILWEAYKLETT